VKIKIQTERDITPQTFMNWCAIMVENGVPSATIKLLIETGKATWSSASATENVTTTYEVESE
jgi:hypothetical protein